MRAAGRGGGGGGGGGGGAETFLAQSRNSPLGALFGPAPAAANMAAFRAMLDQQASAQGIAVSERLMAVIIQRLILDKLRVIQTTNPASIVERIAWFQSPAFLASIGTELPSRENITEGRASYTGWLTSVFQAPSPGGSWREGVLAPVSNQAQCLGAMFRATSGNVRSLQTQRAGQEDPIICYLCRKPITEAHNTMHCEHILPILSALSHLWLVKHTDLSRYTAAELGTLLLEYAWSHACCNYIKAEINFIRFSAERGMYVPNDTGIASVVDAIAGSRGRYDCTEVLAGGFDRAGAIASITDKIIPILDVVNSNLAQAGTPVVYSLYCKFKLLSAILSPDFDAIIALDDSRLRAITETKIVRLKDALRLAYRDGRPSYLSLVTKAEGASAALAASEGGRSREAALKPLRFRLADAKAELSTQKEEVVQILKSLLETGTDFATAVGGLMAPGDIAGFARMLGVEIPRTEAPRGLGSGVPGMGPAPPVAGQGAAAPVPSGLVAGGLGASVSRYKLIPGQRDVYMPVGASAARVTPDKQYFLMYPGGEVRAAFTQDETGRYLVLPTRGGARGEREDGPNFAEFYGPIVAPKLLEYFGAADEADIPAAIFRNPKFDPTQKEITAALTELFSNGNTGVKAVPSARKKNMGRATTNLFGIRPGMSPQIGARRRATHKMRKSHKKHSRRNRR